MPATEKCGQKRPPPLGDDNDGGGKRPAVPAPPSDDDEADMCWLCHEDGPDESGHPLRRDCSCRGGSGWAHFPCIVGYAKQKTEQWRARDGVVKFNEPWWKCPSCKQEYQNELAVELANEFLSFVKEKYPDDHLRHVWALRRKLDALLDVFGQMQQHQKEEVEQTGNKILSIIEQMKTANPTLPKAILQYEGDTYNNLGCFAFKEGTKKVQK